MNKAVLISINPKWCELIASGKKTVEVRKTKPKLETPFKVYIYCTKNTRKYALHTYINSGYGRKKFGVIGQWRSGKEVVYVNSHLPAYRYDAYLAEGKVIGEFVCDNIGYVGWFRTPDDPLWVDMLCGESCLTSRELYEYSKGGCFYEWHISDLVIYDKPRELSEFKPWNRKECFYSDLGLAKPNCSECHDCYVKRPPQSWCYVEGVQRDE